jgi:hypothetical protein
MFASLFLKTKLETKILTQVCLQCHEQGCQMVCSQFGSIMEGLRMEKAGIFYGHLEYFKVIWYILWPFGNVVVILYIFPRFGKLSQEKSGNPGHEASS